MKGFRFVEEIVLYSTEEDFEDLLQSFHFDMKIIDEEHKEKNFTGRTYS